MASDASEYSAQVTLEFDNLEEIQAKLGEAIGSGVQQGNELAGKMVAHFESIQLKMVKLREVLKRATSEADFKEARDAMTFIARDANKTANALLRTKGINLTDAAKIKAAAREMNMFARAQETLAKGHLKTSLAAQNVVRIVQDAPFGMFGIANNIEQLSESFSRLLKQTGSVRKTMKEMFMPLVTGPMAIPFIVSLITAFTLSFDKLSAVFDSAKVKLGLLTQAQADYNKELAKFQKSGVKDIISSIPEDDIQLYIHNLEDAQEKAEKALMASTDAFIKQHGFSIIEAEKAFQRLTADRPKTALGIQTGVSQGATRVDEATQKMADAYMNSMGNVDQARKNLEMVKEGLDRLKKRDDLIFEDQKLRALLGIDPDEDDTNKKTKTTKVKSLEDAAIQLRIDAMEDGIEKTIAQIKLNAKKERSQLIKDFGERKDLLKLLQDKELAQITHAISENEDKILKENEKVIQERNQQLKQEKEQRLKDRLAAIKEDTQITLFGLTEQAMKIRSEINANDPFESDKQKTRLAEQSDLEDIKARIKEMDALLDEGQISEKLYNAELKALKAEEEAIRKESADKIKKIEEDKNSAIRGYYSQAANDMGQFFGNMNALTQKEGEKGLEETKKFLFAQAMAEAIASGISAYSSIMQMEGVPFPVKAVAAGAAMLRITSTLAAAAKRIKSIGKNSSGSVESISGGFVQLNSSVTGQRVSSFREQRQNDRTLTGQSEIVGAITDQSKNFDRLAASIQNQMVMYDDLTAGDIVAKGSKINKQLTGLSDAGA